MFMNFDGALQIGGWCLARCGDIASNYLILQDCIYRVLTQPLQLENTLLKMENGAGSEGRDPSGFLSEIIGAPVTVKLNSGVVYKGQS